MRDDISKNTKDGSEPFFYINTPTFNRTQYIFLPVEIEDEFVKITNSYNNQRDKDIFTSVVFSMKNGIAANPIHYNIEHFVDLDYIKKIADGLPPLHKEGIAKGIFSLNILPS